MRLSLVFELLLIFVFIAFAASRVIDESKVLQIRSDVLRKHQKHHHHQHAKVASVHKTRQQVQDTANKYCSCSAKLCNCCREFNLPVVSLQGPGCASLQYLRGDRLAISMSFGERVLTNTTIDSKKPKPVCMPLPGGVSKFCGRVYNIGRQGEDFNACLGLELRAVQDVEAALRVSCFRFGPKGLKVEAAQPLPTIEQAVGNIEEDEDDDDDDDDDDDEFDFDDVDDIEDEDDDDDDEENDEDDGDNSVDYGTFSVFDDDFIDSLFVPSESGSSGNKRRKVVSTTRAPLRIITRKPIIRKRPIVPASTISTPAFSKPKETTKKATIITTTEKQLPTRKITTATWKRRTRPTQKVTISSTTTAVPPPSSTRAITTTDEAVITSTVTPSTKSIPSTIVTIKSSSAPPTATTRISTTTTTTTTPTTTTTESVGLITSATIVTSEKKPILIVDSTKENVQTPFIAVTKNVSSNEVLATPHESIAAVAAMLQSIPGEAVAVQESTKDVPIVNGASIIQAHKEQRPIEDVTATSATVSVNDYTTSKEIDSTTSEYDSATQSQDITVTPDTTISSITERETTTVDDEDEDEDSVSYIIKNGEEDEDTNDTEESFTTESMTTSIPTTIKTETKTNVTKPESKDVFTDIIDGVVETFGGDTSSEDNTTPGDDDDDDDDDDFLGDDDDDDDEEEDDETEGDESEHDEKVDGENEDEEKEVEVENDEEDDEDDDDDDDDFVGRKAKQHKKIVRKDGRVVRGRQSRDMWLDRLHW